MTWAQITGLLLGFLVMEILRRLKEKRSLPYTWKCPNCSVFVFKANDKNIIDLIAIDHMSEFHPEEDA